MIQSRHLIARIQAKKRRAASRPPAVGSGFSLAALEEEPKNMVRFLRWKIRWQEEKVKKMPSVAKNVLTA